MKNKKANYADIVSYFKIALALMFLVTISLLFMQGFNSEIQSRDNSTIPSAAKDLSTEYTEWLPGFLDMAFLFVLIGFIIFSVVAARFIPSDPKFIFITILALIILPLGGMFIENIWYGYFQQSAIAVAVSDMVFMPFILNNLVFVALFYSAAVAVALLTKDKGQA